MSATTTLIVPPLLELGETAVSEFTITGSALFNYLQGQEAVQVGGAQFTSHSVMAVVSITPADDPQSYQRSTNVQLAYQFYLPVPSRDPLQEITEQGICWLIWKHPLTRQESPPGQQRLFARPLPCFQPLNHQHFHL